LVAPDYDVLLFKTKGLNHPNLLCCCHIWRWHVSYFERPNWNVSCETGHSGYSLLTFFLVRPEKCCWISESGPRDISPQVFSISLLDFSPKIRPPRPTVWALK
jgi:hypothetical protein